MTDVRLDEPITMNILDQQQQIICKINQNNVNFMSQLKVRDLLNALSDYRSLRINWSDNEVPQISITNEDVHECLYILNILRFIDGDNFQNLPEFRRIFLEEELNRCTNEPLWGESANKCSPSEFVNGLMGVIFYLKAINEAINDPQFTGQYIGVNPRTFQSYQNVMQDMTNPENIMQNLLTKLVPMLVDDPEKISSLIERTLLVDHPGGPLLNFVQHTSIASRNEQHEPSHHPTIVDTIRTLESVPDPNMTVAELNEHQSRVKNQRQQEADLEEADDQLLALAIQKSLEEF
ncbi:unnamed protein product [Rotaria sordida]|uniref:Uncharacterized protein n=1 Tax=Rotaria sordida TaxID=392033 RepID=A0A814YEF1_9BILA|nr:unnamed protein product [Rotaria sordida]